MKFNKLIFMIIIFLSSSFYDENIEDEKKYYFGGWPYNNKKDIINGSPLEFNCPNDIGCECNKDSDCINNNCLKSPRGSYCYPKDGDIFPEFISYDQYGDIVNIYDFANQSKYILLELGAVWCAPCNVLSAWFSYNDLSIKSKTWWKPEYTKIYDLVENNEVYFITVLYENENRDLPDFNTSYEWFDNYPDEKIPILTDDNKLLHTWVKPSGIPAVILLNEKMEIIQFSSRGLNGSFDKLLEILKNNDDKE